LTWNAYLKGKEGRDLSSDAGSLEKSLITSTLRSLRAIQIRQHGFWHQSQHAAFEDKETEHFRGKAKS